MQCDKKYVNVCGRVLTIWQPLKFVHLHTFHGQLFEPSPPMSLLMLKLLFSNVSASIKSAPVNSFCCSCNCCCSSGCCNCIWSLCSCKSICSGGVCWYGTALNGCSCCGCTRNCWLGCTLRTSSAGGAIIFSNNSHIFARNCIFCNSFIRFIFGKKLTRKL